MAEPLKENNAPLNMRRAYQALQQLYGEEPSLLFLERRCTAVKPTWLKLRLEKTK